MENMDLHSKTVQSAWVQVFVTEPIPQKLKKIKKRNTLPFKASSRAYHDQLAAFLRFADQTTPSYSSQELHWYQIFEQARCDSLAIAEFKGIALNISVGLKQLPRWSLNSALYILCSQYFWSDTTSLPSADADFTAILTELPDITTKSLENASRFLNSPEGFRTCIADLVRQLAIDYAWQAPKNPNKAEAEISTHQSPIEIENVSEPTLSNTEQASEPDSEETESVSFKDPASQVYSWKKDGHQKYQVFSKKYDEILLARDISTSKDHQAFMYLRATDHTEHRRLVRKIAHRLLRKLMIANQRTWLFDQEQGYVDPTRLTRLITQSQISRIFRAETHSPIPDTVVTLLVDQSGSMDGERSRMATLSLDVIVSALESCSIKCEVLGYTTPYWADNPLVSAWQSQPGKVLPGRLNATRHIIYKEAEIPWRQVAKHCGVMLRDDFGRENIDGEALLWASGRLKKRYEPNKILLVLSDGSPMDEATLSANSKRLLADHLRQVIHEIETDNKIKLAAIGIGHEVGRFYSRGLKIDKEVAIGEALETELVDMIIQK